MIKITCDVCGTELRKNLEDYIPVKYDYLSSKWQYGRLNLCPSCNKLLIDIGNGAIAEYLNRLSTYKEPVVKYRKTNTGRYMEIDGD